MSDPHTEKSFCLSKEQTSKFLSDNRGFFFDAFFVLNSFFLAPLLIGAVARVKEGSRDIALALILLMITILEIVGLWIKLPSLYKPSDKKSDGTVSIIFLWVAHSMIGTLIGIIMIAALGLSTQSMLGKLILAAIVAKELFILILLLPPFDRKTAPPEPSKNKQIIGDLCITIFGGITYTALWSSADSSMLLSGVQSNLADSTLYLLFHYTFFFLLFYLPTRMVYFIREWFLATAWMTKLCLLAYNFIAVASGTYHFYIGPDAPDRDQTNTIDAHGHTLLTSDVFYAPLRSIKKLIAAGADVNIPDATGARALSIATREGRTKAVDLLIASGAEIEAKDNKGDTTLIIAAGSYRTDILTLLLKHGADLNAQNNEGITALMMASVGIFPKTIQLLTEAGAKVDLRDKEGMTALMHAIHFGREANVRTLITAGADVNAKDRFGKDVIWHTHWNGYTYDHIVDILKDAGAR